MGSAPADVPPSRRSSFIGDLRTVLASGGFRKLYATRLISQTGDGVFNAGLGAYVFFNATSFPDPAFLAALVECTSNRCVSDLPFELGAQTNASLLPHGIFGDTSP